MEWKIAEKSVDYPEALEIMEQRVEDIIAGRAPELVWLVEHPPLYTAGTSAKATDLFKNAPFPTYDTGRGGEWTYHGPGQRVVYLMLDLKKRNAMDVRAYVKNLENWIIATLAEFGVEGFIREGRVGVWTHVPPGGKNLLPLAGGGKREEEYPEAKIAAIGIRVRKWVTYHGIAINVSPDLSHYAGIVPCGIKEHGVTSLKALSVKAAMKEVDTILRKKFDNFNFR
jgi:lipoyl(octanoyl) transferase